MEKSKVRVTKNRCGRKIKAKTANGRKERKDEIKGAREGEKQKSQSSYGLWRRRSVLICFQVVVQIFHFVTPCLHLKLFVNASSAALFCFSLGGREFHTEICRVGYFYVFIEQ